MDRILQYEVRQIVVAFVVLNWNNSELTLKAMHYIVSHELPSLPGSKLIVVDNGSDPEEKQKLVEYFIDKKKLIINEDIENNNYESMNLDQILVLNKRNYGYAKGNNIGLKLARKLGFKYAVIMNNDVKLKEPVTKTLLCVLQRTSDIKAAVVGPKVITINGKQQGPYMRPGIYSEFFLPIFAPILYPF